MKLCQTFHVRCVPKVLLVPVLPQVLCFNGSQIFKGHVCSVSYVFLLFIML